ncbi:hypothetical protein Ancab_036682 [Ancistrocladus abbreviatus]
MPNYVNGNETLQVDRMMKGAERFAKEDEENRDAIYNKETESVTYHTEKKLKELGDKVLAGVKEKIATKVQELKGCHCWWSCNSDNQGCNGRTEPGIDADHRTVSPWLARD